MNFRAAISALALGILLIGSASACSPHIDPSVGKAFGGPEADAPDEPISVVTDLEAGQLRSETQTDGVEMEAGITEIESKPFTADDYFSTVTGEPQSVPHEIREGCSSCHDADSTTSAPMPANHQGMTDEFCANCHESAIA